MSTSNAVDTQAGYESVWAIWGAIMGGANFVMHGAGWMEGGLHASYEKMVVDADLLHMVATMLAMCMTGPSLPRGNPAPMTAVSPTICGKR